MHKPFFIEIIQRLEQRVSELETELAAARAEISAEAMRTSSIEVALMNKTAANTDDKIDLKKDVTK